MSREISLRLDLLDRQIVDCEELPVGRVDDLQIELRDGGAHVEALLTGAQAIGERIGGWRGAIMAGVAARLRGREHQAGPAAIAVEAIEEIDLEVQLGMPLSALPHVAGLEHWLARHVIGPIPGSGHDAGE